MSPKPSRGAGRKPTGPFAHNTQSVTLRMPADMRAELEAAARKKGWAFSQEVLWRLRASLHKTVEDERRPSVRAMAFLVAELIERTTMGLMLDGWHRNPFLFRAVRHGVAKLLEALEPPGKVESPFERLDRTLGKSLPVIRSDLENYKTPEAAGKWGAASLLDALFHPPVGFQTALRGMRDSADPKVAGFVEYMLQNVYGMADAKRDIGLDRPKEEPTSK